MYEEEESLVIRIVGMLAKMHSGTYIVHSSHCIFKGTSIKPGIPVLLMLCKSSYGNCIFLSSSYFSEIINVLVLSLYAVRFSSLMLLVSPGSLLEVNFELLQTSMRRLIFLHSPPIGREIEMTII